MSRAFWCLCLEKTLPRKGKQPISGNKGTPPGWWDSRRPIIWPPALVGCWGSKTTRPGICTAPNYGCKAEKRWLFAIPPITIQRRNHNCVNWHLIIPPNWRDGTKEREEHSQAKSSRFEKKDSDTGFPQCSLVWLAPSRRQEHHRTVTCVKTVVSRSGIDNGRSWWTTLWSAISCSCAGTATKWYCFSFFYLSVHLPASQPTTTLTKKPL